MNRTDAAPTHPQARLVGGMWLPKDEEHLAGMLLQEKKRQIVDGRHTYQLHKLQRAMELLPQSRRRVAVDAGAHVGLWAVHLVALFAHVEAFEPVPLHRELFALNVAPVGTNYTLHGDALGAEAGSCRLDWRPTDTGNTHVVEACADPAALDVPVYPLDAYTLGDVDFVKIDVEGQELAVVEGAEATIRRCGPMIVVEQKGNDAKFYGRPRDEARRFLEERCRYVAADCISGDYIMMPRGGMAP